MLDNSTIRVNRPEPRRSPDSGLAQVALARTAPADSYLHVPVHARISDQVRVSPQAVAVASDEQEITYAQLERRSNQLAHYLQTLGVGPDTVVGLSMERCPDMIVALLAILKAGGAYLPLDPSYPTERLAYMLDDAGITVLISQAALADALPTHTATLIEFDSAMPDVTRQSEMPPACQSSPENLAYVIYTSGSTGRPKGVMIPHHALSNHMIWMKNAHPLASDDVLLQKTPLSFDASVWEIFLPLMCGATVFLAKPGGHKDPAYLCHAVSTHGVTTLQLVPSMLRLFLDEPGIRRCSSLRNIFSGGETLTKDLCDKVFDRLNANLHNLYGPTETCIQVVVYTCARGERYSGMTIPIGKPIPNTNAYVLDEDRRPVSPGTPGELYIGGACLARGYLGKPALTGERFVPNPFGEKDERMYCTGDIVRCLADGNLEFLGRIDHQVKVHGYRVELGEIELALSTHPAILQSVVVTRQRGGERRLIAYVVCASTATVKLSDLREHLRHRLPHYMVPSTFVFLEQLPVTPNGKIDREALPAPMDSDDDRASYVAPRTSIEVTLADVWSEVLGIDHIGTEDDFFDLGGTSLDLVRMFGLANSRLGTSVALDAVASGASLATLSSCFEGALHK